MPAVRFSSDLPGRSAKYFPLVGWVIGCGGAAVYSLAARWWSSGISALLALLFFVLITGGLHEDALADAADGFGGGWNRERVLELMRDSRIGSYGGLALTFSLLGRWMLLSELPPGRLWPYLVAAHVLSRWTALPLAFLLPSARSDGSGAHLAEGISKAGLACGSFLAAAIIFVYLGSSGWISLLVTLAVVLITGGYYWRRLGGVTGDCFGATNQMSEVAVYLCGCALPRA